MTSDTHRSIELSHVSPEGRRMALSASLAPSGGWDVTVKVDEQLVTVAHCGDWHRVERLQACFVADTVSPA